MENKNNGIEHIELYLTGQMSENEKSQFEDWMRSDSNFHQEVKDYEILIKGLQGIELQQFKNQLNQWNTDWQNYGDLDEELIIEEYLKGNLHQDQVKLIHKKINEDASFAQKIRQYNDIYDGFKAIDEQNFIATIKGWSEESKLKPVTKQSILKPLYRRLSWAAILIVIAGTILFLSQNGKFDSELVASDYFEALHIGSQMGGDKTVNEIEDLIEKANNLFVNKDFKGAALNYEKAMGMLSSAGLDAQTSSMYRENLEWNFLLCRIGLDEIDEKTFDLIENLVKNENHSYHSRAVELKSKLK